MEEFLTAHNSGDKQIIPVLAEGAIMPSPKVIPSDCQDFLIYNALRFEPDRRERALVQGVRQSLKGRKDDATYVFVGRGNFDMGVSELDREASDNEKPRHEVELPEGFWIGQIPVTVREYERYLSEEYPNKRRHPRDGFDNPVVNVSWMEARAYCEWAGGSLPKEVEWEYAARAGKKYAHCGCDDLDKFAWWSKNARGKPQKVGLKDPNWWGLHDVLGNVWEWCLDCEIYETRGTRQPFDASAPELRVSRGGSCSCGPDRVRVSARQFLSPDTKLGDLGFRCVIRDKSQLRPTPPTADRTIASILGA